MPVGGEGFSTVAGHHHGLHRVLLAAGTLPTGAGGPGHLHHGEEILLIRAGVLEVTVDRQHRRCTAGDVVVVPADTVHGFSVVTETTLEVIAEQGAGQIFPILDEQGSTRLVEVYRKDMPWSRRPPKGFDWTSDEEIEAILEAVATPSAH